MKFIDKNNEILFQTMHHSEIEETAICISQVFSSFEPITRALKISFNEFYRLAIPVCQKAADEEISIIAKDRKTGEVVGFIISEDFMTINPDSPEGIDNKFEPVFSLLSEDVFSNWKGKIPIVARYLHSLVMLKFSSKYLLISTKSSSLKSKI